MSSEIFQLCKGCPNWILPEDKVIQFIAATAKLKTRISSLRSALEFYADKKMWTAVITVPSDSKVRTPHMPIAVEDREFIQGEGGVTARKALAEDSE